MKLTPADKALSTAIREAHDWTCQKCGIVSAHGQATGGDRGMQCSHFIGRKHKSTRYDTDNVLCLCASCHAKVEEDPGLHTRVFTEIMGKGIAEILTERKQQAFKPVGGWKQYEKEAAAHYRAEFESMRRLRADGVTGKIEIKGY